MRNTKLIHKQKNRKNLGSPLTRFGTYGFMSALLSAQLAFAGIGPEPYKQKRLVQKSSSVRHHLKVKT